MKQKFLFILTVLLGLCVLLFGLTACDSSEQPAGNSHTKIYGIELTIYDENNNVIDTISSVTENEPQKLSLTANRRYTVLLDFVQSGGSAVAVILADTVIWNYDSDIMNIEKCNDVETDASYYIVCNNTNKTTHIGVQCGEFSLELNVCIEYDGHTHSFTNYISDGNATCDSNGTKTAICDIEGCTESDTVTNTGSITDHNFENGDFCIFCHYRIPSLHYEISEDQTYCTVKSMGTIPTSQKEIVILSEYKGLPVKRIEDNVFHSLTNIESVVIPHGIESIGDDAFYGCTNLKDISIPDSLTSLGRQAFMGCDMLKLNEFDNGYYIGNKENPFVILIKAKYKEGEKTLDSCLINERTKFVYDKAFYDSGLESVTIPEGLLEIGFDAFYGCKMTSLELPDSITRIGEWAFAVCEKLKSLKIGKNIQDIGKYAFQRCTGLETIYVNAENPIYSGVGNCLIEKTRAKLILGCKNSVIPTDTSVKIIGEEAFSHCEMLTDIYIPQSVKQIEHNAFSYCTALVKIRYESSLSDWAAIEKDEAWDFYAAKFTVYCTDGEIQK